MLDSSIGKDRSPSNFWMLLWFLILQFPKLLSGFANVPLVPEMPRGLFTTLLPFWPSTPLSIPLIYRARCTFSLGYLQTRTIWALRPSYRISYFLKSASPLTPREIVPSLQGKLQALGKCLFARLAHLGRTLTISKIRDKENLKI